MLQQMHSYWKQSGEDLHFGSDAERQRRCRTVHPVATVVDVHVCVLCVCADCIHACTDCMLVTAVTDCTFPRQQSVMCHVSPALVSSSL